MCVEHSPGETDLLGALKPQGVARGELELLLRDYFGSASLQGDELTYPNDSNYALKLSYDEERLVDIVAGPAFTSEMFNALQPRIHTALLEDAKAVIWQVILFSHALPVKGWWRYKDHFQIIPVPGHAPQSPLASLMVEDHPFILQYSVRGSSNAAIRGLRSGAVERRLALLLHTFLEGAIREKSGYARSHWVLLPGNVHDLQVGYCQNMYTFKDFKHELSEFSPIQQIQKINATDRTNYYALRGLSGSETLEVPENLENLFDRFFSLPLDAQDRFLRACYWLRHSWEVQHVSRSASYIALVQAIESLLGRTNEVCEKCGQLRHRITKRFQQFLESFVPEIKQSNAREALYKIRSGLSHGEFLFDNDRFQFFGMIEPKGARELSLGWQMGQVARIALINWLLAQHMTCSETKGDLLAQN